MNRKNHVRQLREPQGLIKLRNRGITLDGEEEPYIVGGKILYWPRTEFWRAIDCTVRGYGTDSLINALGPEAQD